MDVVASDLPTPCPDGELEEGELEDGELSSDDFVDDIAVSAAVPSALASELPGFGRVYQTGLRKGMRVFPIPQRRTSAARPPYVRDSRIVFSSFFAHCVFVYRWPARMVSLRKVHWMMGSLEVRSFIILINRV